MLRTTLSESVETNSFTCVYCPDSTLVMDLPKRRPLKYLQALFLFHPEDYKLDKPNKGQKSLISDLYSNMAKTINIAQPFANSHSIKLNISILCAHPIRTQPGESKFKISLTGFLHLIAAVLILEPRGFKFREGWTI